VKRGQERRGKERIMYMRGREAGKDGGRAIAQAVSRWLPTAAARVRARV
jgi:hypothetical protein